MGAVEFFQLEKHAKTVEAIGALHSGKDTVASASGVRTVPTADLSASLFATLGVAPVIGRAFEPAEDLAGREYVVIVSDAFWRRDLGGDPAVLGRVLQVDHSPVVIVGVLSAGAVFPRAEKAELFFPLGITPQQMAKPAARSGLYGFARLRPRVSAAAARASAPPRSSPAPWTRSRWRRSARPGPPPGPPGAASRSRPRQRVRTGWAEPRSCAVPRAAAIWQSVRLWAEAAAEWRSSR